MEVSPTGGVEGEQLTLVHQHARCGVFCLELYPELGQGVAIMYLLVYSVARCESQTPPDRSVRLGLGFGHVSTFFPMVSTVNRQPSRARDSWDPSELKPKEVSPTGGVEGVEFM